MSISTATKVATIDLASTVAVYQQKRLVHWGPLPSGVHTVKIVRSSTSASGKYLTIDAVDIAGTLIARTVEQSDSRLAYKGSWTSVSSALYSAAAADKYSQLGGHLGDLQTSPAHISAGWAGKAPNYGIAKVTVDGTRRIQVDLYNPSALYQRNLWNTGKLPRAPTRSRSSGPGTRTRRRPAHTSASMRSTCWAP